MISGIGTDIIEVNRIRQVIARKGDAFVRKICSPREIAYCYKQPDKYTHLAGRLAAKEAVLKALHLGLMDIVNLNTIEVVNGEKGEPAVHLSGKIADICRQKNLTKLFVSISHSEEYAVGFALVEK